MLWLEMKPITITLHTVTKNITIETLCPDAIKVKMSIINNHNSCVGFSTGGAVLCSDKSFMDECREDFDEQQDFDNIDGQHVARILGIADLYLCDAVLLKDRDTGTVVTWHVVLGAKPVMWIARLPIPLEEQEWFYPDSLSMPRK